MEIRWHHDPPGYLTGEYKDIKIGDLWQVSDGEVMICENIVMQSAAYEENGEYCLRQDVPTPTWRRYNEDGADDADPLRILLVVGRHPWALCEPELNITLDMLAKLGIEELSVNEKRHYHMLMHEAGLIVNHTQFDMDATEVRHALRRLRVGDYMFYDEEIAERLFDQLTHDDRWQPVWGMNVTGSTGPTGPTVEPKDTTGTPIWKVDVSTTDNSHHTNITWVNNFTEPHDNLYLNEAPRDSPLQGNFAVASAPRMCDHKASMWNTR